MPLSQSKTNNPPPNPLLDLAPSNIDAEIANDIDAELARLKAANVILKKISDEFGETIKIKKPLIKQFHQIEALRESIDEENNKFFKMNLEHTRAVISVVKNAIAIDQETAAISEIIRNQNYSYNEKSALLSIELQKIEVNVNAINGMRSKQDAQFDILCDSMENIHKSLVELGGKLDLALRLTSQLDPDGSYKKLLTNFKSLCQNSMDSLKGWSSFYDKITTAYEIMCNLCEKMKTFTPALKKCIDLLKTQATNDAEANNNAATPQPKPKWVQQKSKDATNNHSFVANTAATTPIVTESKPKWQQQTPGSATSASKPVESTSQTKQTNANVSVTNVGSFKSKPAETTKPVSPSSPPKTLGMGKNNAIA